MALPLHPKQFSTLAPIEPIDATAEDARTKLSTSTSTASLSSSSSKDLGVASTSFKKASRPRGSRKRTASVRMSASTPPRTHATDACTPEPITRRFSADKSQFKDIVHQFTGFHRPSPCPRMLDLHDSKVLAAAMSQSLQTLDTISAYLFLHSSRENNILLNEIKKSKNLAFLQALRHSQGSHNVHMGGSTGSLGLSSVETRKPFYSSPIQSPARDINMGMLNTQVLPPTSVPVTQKSQQIAELEHALLKDNAPDNFHSLAWVLFKQMASQ